MKQVKVKCWKLKDTPWEHSESCIVCSGRGTYHYDKLEKGETFKDREVVDVRDFPHEEDIHLQLVLCKYREKFVVWQFNAAFKDFNFGYYKETLEEAQQIFKERMEYYNIK